MIGPQTSRNGVVAIDARTTRSLVARGDSLASTSDDLSRLVMPLWGGVRRSTQRDHKA